MFKKLGKRYWQQQRIDRSNVSYQALLGINLIASLHIHPHYNQLDMVGLQTLVMTVVSPKQPSLHTDLLLPRIINKYLE